MRKFVQLHMLAELREGDIVRGVLSGTAFVVCANYGDHVTAVRVQDISQPSEWLVMRDVSDPIDAAVDADLAKFGDDVKAMARKLAKDLWTCVRCGAPRPEEAEAACTCGCGTFTIGTGGRR